MDGVYFYVGFWLMLLAFSLYVVGRITYQMKLIPVDFIISEEVKWDHKLNPYKITVYFLFLPVFLVPFYLNSAFFKLSTHTELITWLAICSVVLIVSYGLVEFKIKSKTKRYITEDKSDTFNKNCNDYAKNTGKGQQEHMYAIFNNIILQKTLNLVQNNFIQVLVKDDSVEDKKAESKSAFNNDFLFLYKQGEYTIDVDCINDRFIALDLTESEIESIYIEAVKKNYFDCELSIFKSLLLQLEPRSKIVWKPTACNKRKNRQALLSFLDDLFPKQFGKMNNDVVALIINRYFEFNEVSHPFDEKQLYPKLISDWLKRNLRKR